MGSKFQTWVNIFFKLVTHPNNIPKQPETKNQTGNQTEARVPVIPKTTTNKNKQKHTRKLLKSYAIHITLYPTWLFSNQRAEHATTDNPASLKNKQKPKIKKETKKRSGNFQANTSHGKRKGDKLTQKTTSLTLKNPTNPKMARANLKYRP